MTSRIEHLAEGVTLHCGDCVLVLPELAENSIDSCVTDPPYGLGFMGKGWDHGVPDVGHWKAIFRVLKPGAYIVSFSSARTYHRMACAIEDAGFITHPLIGWITGQGFPKAHSVSKHIDKMAGAERRVVGTYRSPENTSGFSDGSGVECMAGKGIGGLNPITAPATDAARQWDGWYYGTQSLKPAIEPIYVGQKPFEKGLNGTQNVLKWGTGALNIDGCRVETDEIGATREHGGAVYEGVHQGYQRPNKSSYTHKTDWKMPPQGRWPANVIHDGSDEVVGAFPESAGGAGGGQSGRDSVGAQSVYGEYKTGGNGSRADRATHDSGSAARFFYTAKADSDDRLGSKHPTVKPLDLMQYLVRLVTPPKGLCLDPFAGTGTTGEACIRECMRAVLIEREPEYQDDIRRRMKLAMSGPDERSREAIKAKHKDKPVDHGPLFAPSTGEARGV